MLKATKKNRQVKITEEKAKYYEELGYTITDEKGKVIYKPRDVEEELKEAQATIKKLEAEVAKLKKADAKKAAAKKVEADGEAAD